VQFDRDPRVLYEPGAEIFASQIAAILPVAVEKVETQQYISFREPPKIYVCASKDSYYKLSGTRARAVVTNKLLLSPELKNDPESLSLMLTHELSHLHLLQHVGQVAFIKLPPWFKEGLATLVSGGGGASTVSDNQALMFIRDGKYFIPEDDRGLISSLIFPHYSSFWHLDHQMYYRQCMMFVAFMKINHEYQFKNFMISIMTGNNFQDSFSTFYKEKLGDLWGRYLNNAVKAG
jgi:hypothetical protein